MSLNNTPEIEGGVRELSISLTLEFPFTTSFPAQRKKMCKLFLKISIFFAQRGLELPEGRNLVPEDQKFKEMCEAYIWNFQRGLGSYTKIPSIGEVWIFSRTTQCSLPQMAGIPAKQNKLSSFVKTWALLSIYGKVIILCKCMHKL